MYHSGMPLFAIACSVESDDSMQLFCTKQVACVEHAQQPCTEILQGGQLLEINQATGGAP